MFRRLKRKLFFIGSLWIILFVYHDSRLFSQLQTTEYKIQNTVWEEIDNFNSEISTAKSNIILDFEQITESVDNKNITVDAKDLYSLTPAEIMKAPSIKFIPGIKTPCFIVNNPPAKDNGVWISDNQVVKCWPYLQLVGVEKSGTTDLFDRLSLHHHFMSMRKADGYIVKEAQFFNGLKGSDRHNNSMEGYLGLMNNATHIINQQCPHVFKKKSNGTCPYMLADFSARNLNHYPYWKSHIGNENFLYPHIFASDKIKHIYPQSKIIIMLRNPVTRLFSDYRFYPDNIISSGGNISSADFHERVTEAIDMWRYCIETLKLHEDICAYSDRTWPGPNGEAIGSHWGHHSDLRLKVSIYSLYVDDWIDRFSKENMLIIKMEEYSKWPLKFIEETVLPFLGLEPFTSHVRKQLLDMETINMHSNDNKNRNNLAMWPSTKNLLEKFYEPYNIQLASMLNNQKFLWKD